MTTSRMCLTLVRVGFLFSANLALRAASQSKTEWTERALNGDLAVMGVALMGESTWEKAGEGGIFRLGKDASPFGGADMGSRVKGLGGIAGALAGTLCWCSHLHEQSVASLVAVEGKDSVVAVSSSEVSL